MTIWQYLLVNSKKAIEKIEKAFDCCDVTVYR